MVRTLTAYQIDLMSRRAAGVETGDSAAGG
jgi:hypothetical protein